MRLHLRQVGDWTGIHVLCITRPCGGSEVNGVTFADAVGTLLFLCATPAVCLCASRPQKNRRAAWALSLCCVLLLLAIKWSAGAALAALVVALAAGAATAAERIGQTSIALLVSLACNAGLVCWVLILSENFDASTNYLYLWLSADGAKRQADEREQRELMLGVQERESGSHHEQHYKLSSRAVGIELELETLRREKRLLQHLSQASFHAWQPNHISHGRPPRAFSWTGGSAPETGRLRIDARFAEVGDLARFSVGFFRRAQPDQAAMETVLRLGHSFFVEVVRNSRGEVLKGFGRETDDTGWWHFIAPGSGILLQVGTPVLDYTCPTWVVNATTGYQLRIVPRTGKHNFTASFGVKCVADWCTPCACKTASFSEDDQVTRPAFWKGDPPFREHRLRAIGFASAISFWGRHTGPVAPREFEPWQTAGPKMLQDLRKYNTTDRSYSVNGSAVFLSCQPRAHRYYVVEGGQLRPCQCKSNRFHLNCHQLPVTHRLPRFAPARLVAAWPNGTLCINISTCMTTAQSARFLAKRGCDVRTAYMPWPPAPGSGSACPTP